MIPPEFLANALALLVATIPLLAALWKVFDSIASLKERLNSQITAVGHQTQLIELELKSLNEKGQLAINGLKERHDHSINRLKAEFERLDQKVEQIEGFLAKASGYEIRH